MKKKIEKGTEEFEFFGDLFAFKQEFYVPEYQGCDWYWKDMVGKADAISRKYKNCEFNKYGIVDNLMIAMVKDLSAKSKEKEKMRNGN